MGSLTLPQIAESQAAAYVTSNDADAALEKAICNTKSNHDASGGNITITDADFRENWFHIVGGTAAAAFNMVVPTIARPFMVGNASGHTATIKTPSGNAGQLLDGETRLFYCDGTHIHALSDTSSAGAATPIFSGALLTLSANQVVATGTMTTVEWGAESYDTNSFHDTVTLPGRFTIPAGVNKIILTGQVRWDGNTSGNREIVLHKNGSDTYAGRVFLTTAASNSSLMNFTSPPLDVVPGDYFELKAWQNSGGSRSIEQNAATWFGIQAIG